MKNGVKRVVSMLMALVMACSLAVPPVLAANGEEDGAAPMEEVSNGSVEREEDPDAPEEDTDAPEEDSDAPEEDADAPEEDAGAPEEDAGASLEESPDAPEEDPDTSLEEAGGESVEIAGEPMETAGAGTVTLNKYEIKKYIYANSEYNSLEKMPELVGAISGTYNGEEVELIPVDWKKPDKLFHDFKGSTSGYAGFGWGTNSFTATSFTVKDTEEKVQTQEGSKLSLHVGVIAVNANTSFDVSRGTVQKDMINRFTGENYSVLGLPGEASVTYEAARVPGQEGSSSEDWNNWAGEFSESDCRYRIVGWKMGSGYGTDLTPTTLQNIAGETGDAGYKSITLSPIFATEGDNAAPAWATAITTTFTLTIVDHTPVKVTVTPPADITYGEELGPCSASQEEINSGGMDSNNRFIYRYTSTSGGYPYYNSTTPPTDAGTYQVVAVLDSATHSGVSVPAEFTIHKKPVTLQGLETIRAQDAEYNANGTYPKLDTSGVKIVGAVPGDELSFWDSASFQEGNSLDVGEYLVKYRFSLEGKDRDNYSLSYTVPADPIYGRIVPDPLTIDDSGIVVTKEYDGTTDPGVLKGTLGFKGYDPAYAFSDIKLVWDKTPGPYEDAAAGTGKTVTLTGVKLTGGENSGKVKNFRLVGVDENGNYTCQRGEITGTKPVLGEDFTVVIPSGAVYNGEPHPVTVTKLSEGLGEVTVTYTLKEYPYSTTDAPVKTGTYGVIVSFKEGEKFPAMEGPNAFNVGELVIGKGTGTASVTYYISVGKTVSFSMYGLNLPDNNMVGGICITEFPALEDIDGGSEVLESLRFSSYSGFEVKAKETAAGKSVKFQFTLSSDCYEKVVVDATIAVSTIRITAPPTLTVNDPGTFPYGTRLKDIVKTRWDGSKELEGGSAMLGDVEAKGKFFLGEDLERIYEPGEYKDLELSVYFAPSESSPSENPEEWVYATVPVSFTVEKKKITLDSIQKPDKSYVANGYFQTIFANSDGNASEESLLSFIQREKGTYTAVYGKYRDDSDPSHVHEADLEVGLKAAWTADSGNPEFAPKGNEDIDLWYSYTGTWSVDEEDKFDVSSLPQPKAYIRVLPVIAEQHFTQSSAIVRKSDVDALSSDDWASLGLPGTVNVEYSAPDGIPQNIIGLAQWPTEKTYTVSGWETEDGQTLTYQKLQQLADDAGSKPVKLVLTPVYSGANTDRTTLKEPPAFTLTVTGKQLADVMVTPPGSITYGDTLGAPSASAAGVSGASFTYRYVRTDGKGYDSATPPTAAGTYQVIATLESETHSGEGTSAEFEIRRAKGEIRTDIAVPVNASQWSVPLTDLGLPKEMSGGAKLKLEPAIAGSGVLEEVTGKAGDTSVILKTKETAGASQDFKLCLETDNYVELTVTVTVTTIEGDIVFINPDVTVKGTGTFPYGTRLADIVQVSSDSGSATLGGNKVPGVFTLKEPEKICPAGRHTSVEVQFSGSVERTLPVETDFTIQKAAECELVKDDRNEQPVYYTIYANDANNTDLDGLKKYLDDKELSYKVAFADKRTDELKAVWKEANDCPEFEPKGYEENVWYTFTGSFNDATLTGDPPEALVRVIPLTAVQGLSVYSSTVSRAEVAALTSNNWSKMGLPGTASITYSIPDTVTVTDDFPELSGKKYRISGWRTEKGEPLTYQMLQQLVGNAGTADVEIKLTPVYDDPEADNDNPKDDRVTLEKRPVCTLIVTGKQLAAVEVTPPGDITYGGTLGAPSATANRKADYQPISNPVFTYRYMSADEKGYNSTVKPTDAGRYVVVATLVNDEYSGEGTSEMFEIKKMDSAECTVNLLAHPDKKWTQPLDDLLSNPEFSKDILKDVPVDTRKALLEALPRGARIKKALEPIKDNDVLEKAVGEKGGTSIELETKKSVSEPVSSFTVILETDNCDKLTVTVNVTVSQNDLVFTPPTVTVKSPGSFPYGTPLSDMVELSKDGSATLDGRKIPGSFTVKDPEQPYAAGTHTDETVEIRFNSTNGAFKDVPVENDARVSFTIQKAEGWSLAEGEEGVFKNGYYIRIYANNEKNTDMTGLVDLVKREKESYQVVYSNGSSGKLLATWSADNNEPFEAKGYKESVWYSFTAGFADATLPSGFTAPKAYVRVIPVTAVQAFANSSKTVLKSVVDSLTSNDWDRLELPKTAGVTYSVSQGVGDDTSGMPDFPEKEYHISGWKTETGQTLTYQLLKQLAADAATADARIRLTPVYSDAETASTTLVDPPVFTLTITGKTPAVVTVTAPGSITYGQPLGNPSAKAEGISNPVFTYRYVSTDGRGYDSTVKPTDVGEYQVIATLVNNVYSGEGISGKFVISRKPKDTARTGVTIPVGTEWTQPLSGLELPEAMLRGAKLRAEAAITGGGVLEAVTGERDGTSFTVKTASAGAGGSRSFTLSLETDNYERLDVTVTVTTTASRLQITPPTVMVKSPGSFPYGTPLREIVELSKDGSATLDGKKIPGVFTLEEPEKLYPAGACTSIQVRFSGSMDQVLTAKTSFTIQKATVKSLAEGENAVYYITVYANHRRNTDMAGLVNLVKEEKPSYEVVYSDDSSGTLAATWRADNNEPFEAKGYKESVWYSFTAGFADATLPSGFTAPKAYVRVIPVTAAGAPEFEGGKKASVSSLVVNALTESDWKTRLGLPEKVSVSYQGTEYSKEAEEHNRDAARSAVYTVTGWRMDGQTLTLSSLKAKAAGIPNGGSVQVRLTPVCTVSTPAWATGSASSALPVFTLTISKDVQIPGDWEEGTASGILGLAEGGALAGIRWNGNTAATLYAARYDANSRLASIRAVNVNLKAGINTVVLPNVPGSGELRLFLVSNGKPLCGAWSSN